MSLEDGEQPETGLSRPTGFGRHASPEVGCKAGRQAFERPNARRRLPQWLRASRSGAADLAGWRQALI